MISSLVECLGCLIEPSVAEVTAAGVNWCIGSYVDFLVICERDHFRVRAPAEHGEVRSSYVCLYPDT